MNNKNTNSNVIFKILTICELLVSFIILLINMVIYDKGVIYLILSNLIATIIVIKAKFKFRYLIGGALQLSSSIILLFNPNIEGTFSLILIYGLSFIGLIMTLDNGKTKLEENDEELTILENTEIKDDVEQWFQDCYMCWIIINNDKENWNKIAGRNKTQDAMNEHREVLARDWGIYNKEELLEMVYSLTEESINTLRKEITAEDIKRLDLTNIESYLAWDLCRAVQILGMGYISDFITRDEMRAYSIKACKLIQKEFSSWDDLIRNYLIGCKRHFESLDMHQDRTSNYEMLRDKKIAYQVDWNLNLE